MKSIHDIINSLQRVYDGNTNKSTYTPEKPSSLLKELANHKRNGKVIIVEARWDDHLNQFFTGIATRLQDNTEVNTIISDAINFWNRYRKNPSFANFPNNWKFAMADYLKRWIINLLTSAAPEDRKLEGLKNRLNAAEIPNKGAFLQIHTELEHFSAWLDYHDVKNFDPLKYDSVASMLQNLGRITTEISHNEQQWLKPTGNEKLILNLGKFKWYDLRETCSGEEGKAMGHCGNVPSARHGDTVLSLRQTKNVGGEELHRPSLTFILRNGYLGEMKGRANQKPKKEYHPYIVELLKLPIIKGISGGGYEPENNFSVSDLSKELYNELKDARGDEFMNEIPEGELIYLQIMHKLQQYESGNRSIISEIIDDVNEYLDEKYHGYHERKFPLYVDDRTKEVMVDMSLIHDDDRILRGYGKIISNGYIDPYMSSDDIPSDYDMILTAIKEKNNDVDQFISKLVEIYRDDITDYAESVDIEVDGMDDDELHDFVLRNFEDMIRDGLFDEVKSAYENAYISGVESGTYDEMYNGALDVVKEIFTDLGLPIDDQIYAILDGSKSEVTVSPNNVSDLIKSYLRTDGLADEEYSINEPYYGFSDFSEEAFNDVLINNLLDENLL